MIKLNDTNAAATATINVLGEDELAQVVGGCSRGHRRNWGRKHCSPKRTPERGCGRRYDDGDYGYGYGYGQESDSDSVEVSNQVVDIDITINQVAV